MKTIILSLACLLMMFRLEAADGDYHVGKVSQQLLKNANAVIRYQETRFEVESLGKSRLYRKYAITILNENGDKFSNLVEPYDETRSVRSIEGTLYDANGKKLKSLKKGDIRDFSGTDAGTLADDNRVKVHNFYYRVYPYTIEYEVDIKYDGTFLLPDFIPQYTYNLAVQHSNLTIVCPESFKIRYRNINYTKEPVIKTEKGNQFYIWEGNDFTAIVREPLAPAIDEITPRVLVSPLEFELENVRGSNASWNEFGKFVYQLKAGRDALPADIKQTVHTLTDGIKDPKEKVRILYQFLQKNTRYISIQFGIGGLQPFPADFVATKRYGDCKALSNYMYALLKEANINSLYTVIEAGEGEDNVISEFPANQFNHVILCVPVGKDTMWLECTSQTKSAGYMGGFTGDRYALLATEAGGKLVRTPKYGISDNLQLRNVKATIDDAGTLHSEIVTSYKARQQDELHELINNESNDKVKQYLKTAINLPTYDIEQFDYKEDKAVIPTITETLKVVSTNYAQVTGKRLFVAPNILTKSSSRYLADEERKYGMELTYEYADIDTVEITIPEGYTPEALPKDVKLETRFGKYEASMKVNGSKIIYYRSRKQFCGKFPATDYNEFVKYLDQIYKADRAKVVLVKSV